MSEHQCDTCGKALYTRADGEKHLRYMQALTDNDRLTRELAEARAVIDELSQPVPQSEWQKKCAEVERLVTALSFYADTTRYYGPNQRLDEPDEWSEQTGLTVYRLDVTRDSGAIARAALSNDALAAGGE